MAIDFGLILHSGQQRGTDRRVKDQALLRKGWEEDFSGGRAAAARARSTEAFNSGRWKLRLNASKKIWDQEAIALIMRHRRQS
jgi:hypothetical protein